MRCEATPEPCRGPAIFMCPKGVIYCKKCAGRRPETMREMAGWERKLVQKWLREEKGQSRDSSPV